MWGELQSTHQLQVWTMLIYGVSICFLAHTLRLACESFWKYLEKRDLKPKNTEKNDFIKSEIIEDNHIFPSKNEENYKNS